MLWQDASPLAGRPIALAWSPPCFDPAGDLFYACFSDPDFLAPGNWQASLAGMGKQAGSEPERTSFEVPLDIISRRPPPPDGSNNAAYGISYVFFAVCAGELTTVPPAGDSTALPFGCKDASGKLLGADDFVAGYTSVYSFDGFSNQNPWIDGFEFRGQPLTDVCLRDDCQALAGSAPAQDFACDDSEHPEYSARCVPACADDGDSTCPAYAFRPTIDKDDSRNHEIDTVSAAQLGRTVGEQMWVDYYTDAGGFKSPVRLLNDATNGWNDDYGTDFYAPKQPGPMRIWAIAHDNRGGVAWAGITLNVQ
jgi:hypothetical protein